MVLRGRRREREVLDELLAAVGTGESRALVVVGEPGVGKTALIQSALQSASAYRLARAVGVESEMELAFAALHQLCAPMLDRLERLPDPQREALATAFGLSAGDAPDRFLVGLAALGLLAEVAHDQPLLCFVDDAQWLDRASAQTLAFVARRLYAESVGVVFATREPSAELRGLPELHLQGLRTGEARELLASAVHGPLDERVRDRIVAETRGNPLALLELPRGLTHAELAGGFGPPDAPALSGRIEESFQRQVAALEPRTQLLLLVAAADPLGDPMLVWRAAERLDIAADAAPPAAAAGLAEFGARVRFRHPLVRSAVYRAASPAQRESVHAALAEATDPEVDPDRRAWHRAQAATGPDEDVAADLERSAERAQRRGGLAAAAAFLERATLLTSDPARRSERALAAAQATHQAGGPDAALRLLTMAEEGPVDELQRARADVLRAQVAFATSRGGDAPPLLLKAARRLEPLDGRRARDTYLDALSAALFVGRLTSDGGVLEAAQAARAAPAPATPPGAPDLLLDGAATLITDGYAAGAPILKRALTAFRDARISEEEEIRWLWLASRVAVNLWDDEIWHVLAHRHVELARASGALAVLPIALSSRIVVHINEGEMAAAVSLTEEQRAIAEATGSQIVLYAGLVVAACQGREPDASRLIEASIEDVRHRGGGMDLAITRWWSALLYNALGRHQDALAAAQEAPGHPPELLFSNWVLPELIEAAARSGDRDRAADAQRRLAETTRASGTDWALGIEARTRALVADGDAADGLYREAIERLGRTRARVHLARAHLLYGEWLRGENRRPEAREQLRTAHEMLTAAGLEAFAERAARELLAAGETASSDGAQGATGGLTAQEAQIARLARDGLSNPEIGARLFISPRTVEYHLHKVFTKLEISSRNQLDGVLVG
jgi:DNA-binding CsgD family transcriptional regulator/tetratricopeptide (TPR) repeat protein